MALITKDEVRRIIDNRPEGTTPEGIVATLRSKGHQLEGYAEVEKSMPPGKNVSFSKSNNIFDKLKERNQSAFGTDSGLITSVLNPVRTSQTDSAAGRLLRGEQGFMQTAFDVAGQGAGAINDVIGEGATIAAKGADYLTGGLLSKGVETVAESEVGQFAGNVIEDIATQYQKFKTAHPEAARNLENTVNIASLIPLAKPASSMANVVKKPITKVSNKIMASFDDIGKKGKPEKTIVDALKGSKALDEASLIREGAEATQPTVSWREKIAGVRPDIKKRISGKQEKLKEYFDVAHARNLDDSVPTPLEYGARNVEKARNELQKVMNDTGSKIGKFRRKISTVQAGVDDMSNVENSFSQSLDGLNLSLNEGKILRKSGKVAGKVSDSEVRTLQGIYDDILRVKAAPSSENLIDLRNAIQDNINFAKTTKEATNVVDPLARKVRGAIRDVNLKMIGKEQGALLDEYSDLIGVLEDMNQFVDSKTGGEFLLKRVLSERGRVPREIMQKVAEYTGVDLMDDATMAQLATEIIGNPAQKGLFRQEITKAGLDAMDVIDVISGSPGGTIRSGLKLLEKSSSVIAPTEKMFMKAAK